MKFTKKLLITALLSFAVLGTARVAYVAYVQKTQFQQAFDAAKKKDFATALKLWQSLAEQGDANSQYNLGLMYSRGEGVVRDDFEAVEWFKKAAEQGNGKALGALGFAYLNGEVVKQDRLKAKEYFGKSCEAKNPVGCDLYRRLNSEK